MNVLFSIIVPVYKIEENLLKNCLQSLIDQDYENVEFLVVDDGSPDNCGAICDEYAAKDSRIHVFHTENKGVSNARNTGIRNANGKYIVFVDGDDRVSPDLCKKCHDLVSKKDADIYFFMHDTSKNKMPDATPNEEVRELTSEEIEEAKLSIISSKEPFAGFWMGPPWGKIYKTELIHQNGLQYVLGLRKCQDRVFVFDYLEHVKKAVLFYYCGYHYVSNEMSICHRYNNGIKEILDFASSEFEKRAKGRSKAYDEAIDTINLVFFADILNLYILNKNNPDNDVERIKKIKQVLHEEKYFHALKHAKYTVSRKRNIPLQLIKCGCYRLGVIVWKLILWS